MTSHRVKLTESFIDNLELEPAIYRDSELIGFAVRVNKSYKTYIVEKKVYGRSIRSTLGIHGQITLVQARIQAQEILIKMTQGVNPNDEKRQKIKDAESKLRLKQQQPTLLEAYNRYISERSLKSRTLDDYHDVIYKYMVDWQDMQLKNIASKLVQEKHKALSKNSKAQANMAMRVLRAIYNFSIAYYLDDDKNPILPIFNPVNILTTKKTWNKVERRTTYIHESQLSDWINTVLNFKDRGQHDETNKDFLLTLILTGFRRNECESIAWSAIDLKYGFITSVDPKSGDQHTLPMGDFLWQLMKKRRRNIAKEWVFPSVKSASGHIVNISKVRQKVNDECGIQFSFHDLRRTFVSIAESLDYDQYIIKKILNHKAQQDGNVMADDAQINDQKLREAMNEIENIILGENRQILMIA